MLLSFSIEEGYLVIAKQGTHASVLGGVFVPSDPIPSEEQSPGERRAFLVVTFPPLRVPPPLRRFIAAAKSVYARKTEAPAMPSPQGPFPRRILPPLATLLVVCAPPWVETLPPAYPATSPKGPFDLGRFEERVPIAEPFAAFEPLRVSTFPSIGFFRTNPPADPELAPWLGGEIAWAQVLRRSPLDEGTWEKVTLEKVECGTRAFFRIAGGTVFRFAGPRDRQRLILAPPDPARICEAGNSFEGGDQ